MYSQYIHIYTAQANTSWNVNWRTRTLWLWRPPGASVVESSNWRLGSEWALCGPSSWTRPPGRRTAEGSGSSVQKPWARPQPTTRPGRPQGRNRAAGPPDAAERPQRFLLRMAASTRRSREPTRWWSWRLAASASGPPEGLGSAWWRWRSSKPGGPGLGSPDPPGPAAGGRLQPREEHCPLGRLSRTEWPLLLPPESGRISGRAPPGGQQGARHLQGEKIKKSKELWEEEEEWRSCWSTENLLTLTHIYQSVSQQLPQSTSVGVRGPDHCQVAVQADEGQDEHAAVQVDCVDNVHTDAGGRSEAPVAHSCVHGPEGQRQNKEEIGSWEVQAIPVCEAALWPARKHTGANQVKLVSYQGCKEIQWKLTNQIPSSHSLTCVGSPALWRPGRSRWCPGWRWARRPPARRPAEGQPSLCAPHRRAPLNPPPGHQNQSQSLCRWSHSPGRYAVDRR